MHTHAVVPPACSHMPPAPTHKHNNTPTVCSHIHASSDIVFTILRDAQTFPINPFSPGPMTEWTVSGLSTLNRAWSRNLINPWVGEGQPEGKTMPRLSFHGPNSLGSHAGLVQVPAVRAMQGGKGRAWGKAAWREIPTGTPWQRAAPLLRNICSTQKGHEGD